MSNVTDEKPVCGVVMPISAIDGCPETHWAEVYLIIKDAISDAGFVGCLVSESDDSGIIHKRIINNLYNNPIVVCDVSGKNPNVMFELGMRLAFDKPTIIIKDSHTAYSFDTSVIEHLEYPRDLRFKSIIDFKKKLSTKIRATLEASTDDENYTTFLKHFGEFKVANIEQKEVSSDRFIIEEMKSMKESINKLHTKILNSEPSSTPSNTDPFFLVNIEVFPNEDLDFKSTDKLIGELLFNLPFVFSHNLYSSPESNGLFLDVICKSSASYSYAKKAVITALSKNMKAIVFE
ncbi:hypothetical protein [Pseudoalteromonas sp. bablab_jr010]|uniref:hypothetical protein n=1 Tax=Pseudoalteromonas sp. bablab_jr010 TaxID=2755063 RepID=UPI0018F57772|nr:hypothetical protein [Pseudoalteromonas sp. bablab_jr010]